MSRITLAGRASIPTTDLDANFTELYDLRGVLGSPGYAVPGSAANAYVYLKAATGYSASLALAGDGKAAFTESAYLQHSSAGLVTYLNAALPMIWSVNGAYRLQLEPTGVLRPTGDNTQTLGAASYRWSVIYAGTGTINTSDARDKTAPRALGAPELAAAKGLAAELGAYKFLAAIDAKGDSGARWHIGMTVQRAIEIMASHGLDPFAYGFICHDEWPAEGEAPAGDRYAFRPDELLLFLARGFESRLAALEALIA